MCLTIDDLPSICPRVAAEVGDSVTEVDQAEQFVKSVVSTNRLSFGIPANVWTLLQYEYTYPRQDGKVDFQVSWRLRLNIELDKE